MSTIGFVRLTAVPLAAVTALLDEPRNRRHLPLATGRVDEESARGWVAAKDAQWETYGYGPWAVLIDGDFAGWGGFQHEETGADFALVLTPSHWGQGAAVTAAALRVGFTELGLSSVTIALPYSRSPDRVVGRLGFVPEADAVHGDVRFRQYRLTREAWQRSTSA